MLTKNKYKRTWIFLLGLSSILFLIIAFPKLLIDKQYLNGIQYLITAITFQIAIYLMTKHKFNIPPRPPNASAMFNIGFIFTVIGLNFFPVLWTLGYIFFLAGICNNWKSPKKFRK